MHGLQVLARNGRAAVSIVQEGALPALAKTAGEGLSDRAQVNATKVLPYSIMPMLCKQCGPLICIIHEVPCRNYCHSLIAHCRRVYWLSMHSSRLYVQSCFVFQLPLTHASCLCNVNTTCSSSIVVQRHMSTCVCRPFRGWQVLTVWRQWCGIAQLAASFILRSLCCAMMCSDSSIFTAC